MQEAGRILLMPCGDYSASETYEMLDLVNHNGTTWVCKKECTGQAPSEANTEYWQSLGIAVDLSNCLPKTGGTLSNNNGVPLILQGREERSLIEFITSQNERLGYIGFEGASNPVVFGQNGQKAGDVLHTGNKPSGTYTGNGDATTRTVNVGGVGTYLIVSIDNVISFIRNTGALVISPTKTEWFDSSKIKYENGTLTIASDSGYFNGSGVVYKYVNA